MIKRNFIVAAALSLCALAWPAAAETGQVQEAAASAYSPEGARACTKCHDKPAVTNVLRTPHGMSADARTPMADHACESCHGASPEHLVKPEEGKHRAPPGISFAKDSRNSVQEQNRVCLDCHSGGHQMNWRGSSHQMADVACTSCHRVHVRKDPMLVKRDQADVCFSCHTEQRAQSYLPYTHPVQQGLVACSDCHNAHGSPTEHLLTGMTVNETCYQCHAEKRGPFLFEHEPVQEDCTLCHSSHGSTERGLLKERAPFLCQECHMGPYHSSNIYGGNRLGDPIPQRELLGRSCMSCHSEIHGSSHPSGVTYLR
jgi:DmsE family decaheme c-type cytochrome